ncbi:ROK family transcriptional regulator [Pseudomonas syringae pv. actinidifoliorum]|uniref:ROK family protein n=1 Tax=Pseudomonas syringae pv. actinidiae ICMP 18807 TaxID=1194404 RepID=S6V8F0_PSESF|nr:ROK family transcriptional regulator [Pseudomonas syringae]EPN63101.1 ROK family protein [Pseudomonas syringae pv. actinidiae ICMP 18807]NAT60057.1 ROK family transcriptional regulator [Pseudomonas syringae pv. actinidifoliorum]
MPLDLDTALSSHQPLSLNERKLLDILRRRGAITRATVSAEMDLAQQSVHRLIEELISRGLLRSGERVKNGRGQPSPRIELVNEAVYAIGVSINTDSAVVCVADLGCNVLEQVTLRTPPLSRNSTLDSLTKTIERMLQRNGIEADRVIGMGFAIAGFFLENRQINAPEPLRDWSLIDLQPVLEERFGMPVWLENNATTAAIGESLVGVGAWASNFIYLSFNFGFGAGVVINGKPYFGSHGNAGEITLYSDEESINRPALRYLLEELHQSGVQVDSIEDLRLRFDPNWPGVDAWLKRIQPTLDRLVNALAGLFDPQAVVFGGQLPAELGQRLIAATTFWGTHRYNSPPPRPRLLLSETNGDAAAIGAALVPLKERFFV